VFGSMVVLRAPRMSTRAALSASVIVLVGDTVAFAVSSVEPRQLARGRRALGPLAE
jgi:hypothetical protein